MFIKSPINYTGGKYRLLPQLLPLFPECSTFVDLFTGGGTVGVNSKAKTIYMNDKDPYVYGLLNYLKHTSSDAIISYLESLSEKYQLTQSYKYGIKYYTKGEKYSSGFASFNKDAYLKLRADFNQKKAESGLIDFGMFFCLIIHSFNYQMRFNKKDEFNTPVGKGDFNNAIHEKIKSFCTALQNKNITLTNFDFREFAIKDDSFVYCDIPYIITDLKVYHTKWNIEDEKAFYNFLDGLKCKWAVSNVFSTNGKTNDLLINWSKNYNVHHLSFDYKNCSYQRKNENLKTDEVLICNY